MEDQLISFKTAKLAKEKGFYWKCLNYWGINNAIKSKPKLQSSFNRHTYNYNGEKYIDQSYSAPTQSLLQRWLREEHEIHIVSKPFYDSKFEKTTFVSDVLSKEHPRRIIKSPRCDEYEEALESALQKALNLIEK